MLSRVIVEAKGCWNKDLKTAMRDQLRDRYLKENQCSHGLYVVGLVSQSALDEGKVNRLSADCKIDVGRRAAAFRRTSC